MIRVDTFAAYFNARIRGMKSALLHRDQLEAMLDEEDVSLLIERLLNSPYEQDMAEALTRFRLADAVEEAVSRNMVRVFQQLIKMAEGELRDLAVIFFLRWDLAAVKGLLRCRHQGMDASASMHTLFPGPTLTVALLRDLAERDSMETLVAGLVAWNPDLCLVLQGQLRQYRQKPSIALFEEALDRNYFVNNVHWLGKRPDDNSRFLCRVLQMEIDRINLRALFQLREADAQAEAVLARLLPAGSLSRRLLQRMAIAHGPEEAMELLGSTLYRELVEGFYQFVQTGRFSPLERLIEMLLIRELRRMARQHVLSIAILIEYAWLKYNEVVNLRMIARGEVRHLPRGRVREEMLYAS